MPIIEQTIAAFVAQLTALAAAYALLVDVLLVAHYVVGERRKLVALANNAMHWLTLLCIPSLMIVQLSPHRWLWTLYALPGCIMFVVWYGRLFVPKRPRSVPPARKPLRVFTYNIAVIGENIQATLHQIRQFDADIIGLQESYGWRVVNPEIEGYPYCLNVYSYTLLSQYPFDRTQTYLLGVKPGRTMPVALRTVLDVEGTPISLYIVHPKRPHLSIRPLIYDSSERYAGVDDLIWHVQAERNPTLMIGDCNMGYRSTDYRRLAHILIDSWRAQGFGLGLTAPADPEDTMIPLLRSDIIWHSAHFTPHRVGVWRNAGGADHYPVWAELSLAPQKKTP